MSRSQVLYLLPPLFKMKFLLAKVLWQSADRIIEEVCGMRLLKLSNVFAKLDCKQIKFARIFMTDKLLCLHT